MGIHLLPDSRHRPLNEVALDIYKNWQKVSPYAQPYLDAMLDLDQIEGTYLLDSATSVVNYFLANAASFKGPEARRLKQELKDILSSVDRHLADKNHRKVYE